MKSFSLINRRLTIRSHVLYSLFVHTVMLTYLLSLPLYRGSLDLRSFEDYFVYLTNEGAKDFGKPSSAYKGEKSEMSGQGMAEDIKTVLKVPEVDTKKSPQRLEAEKPVIPETETMHEMETASEQKIAQVTDIKKPLESSESKGTSLLPEKPKEAAMPQEIREPKKRSVPPPVETEKTPALEKAVSKVKEAFKEKAAVTKEEGTKLGVSEDTGLEAKATPPEVDSGLFLKTMPDNMVIPFDAGFKKETWRVEKEKALGTEKKSGHEIETGEKKVSPAEKKSTPAEEKAAPAEKKAPHAKVEPLTVAKALKEEKAESVKVFESGELLESLGAEAGRTEEQAAAKRKETVTAGKEVHKNGKLAAKEISVKLHTPAEKAKENLKTYEKVKRYQVILDAASALKREAPALKRIPSRIDEPPGENVVDSKEDAKNASSEKISLPKETPPLSTKINEGLLLKTIDRKSVVPFEEAFRTETLPGARELVTEKKTGHEMHRVPAEKVKPEKVTDVREHSRIEEASKEEAPAIKRKDLTEEKREMKKNGQPEKENEKPGEAVMPQVETKPVMTASDMSLEGRVEERPVAEILTPEKNRMPSQKEYFQKLGDKNEQATAAIKPEAKERGVEGEKPPFGIPVPDVLLMRDIKIEILSADTEMSGLTFHLLKKTHPMENRKPESGKQKEIDIAEEKEETSASGSSGGKKLFSVAKAEKGIYTFIIKNRGKKAHDASVVFRLFEGKTGERIKEFKAVQLSPDTVLKLKFILPEAVFWDDEYYFTGTIESSNTLTKFNDRTGLIWKEEKDY